MAGNENVQGEEQKKSMYSNDMLEGRLIACLRFEQCSEEEDT